MKKNKEGRVDQQTRSWVQGTLFFVCAVTPLPSFVRKNPDLHLLPILIVLLPLLLLPLPLGLRLVAEENNNRAEWRSNVSRVPFQRGKCNDPFRVQRWGTQLIFWFWRIQNLIILVVWPLSTLVQTFVPCPHSTMRVLARDDRNRRRRGEPPDLMSWEKSLAKGRLSVSLSVHLTSASTWGGGRHRGADLSMGLKQSRPKRDVRWWWL